MQLRLKDLRQERGLSMQEIADSINMNRSTISRMESGDIPVEKVKIGTLVGICKKLNVKLDELLIIEEL